MLKKKARSYSIFQNFCRSSLSVQVHDGLERAGHDSTNVRHYYTINVDLK